MDFRLTQGMTILNYISLSLNSISLLFGFLYFFFPNRIMLWILFGAIFIVNLIFNFVFVFLTGKYLNRDSSFSKKINILGYSYLLFSPIAAISMLFGNMLISVTYSNRLIHNIGAYILIFLGYFGLLSICLASSIIILVNKKEESIWIKNSKTQSDKHKELRIILIIFSLILLEFGILTSLAMVLGRSNVMLGYLGIGGGIFGLTWFLIFSSMLFLLLQCMRNSNIFLIFAILFFGAIITTTSLLPTFAIPSMIKQAEYNFDQAFNPVFSSNWEDAIPSDVEEFFLKKPYYLIQYFLGSKPKECEVIRDVLYFNGSESSFDVDKNIRLYFDAYLPLNDGTGMPGENSVLIRIHGGGWSFGDKGLTNMMQMNKYFAAQGYIVFDIQYGLYEREKSNPFTPDYVRGDFTKEDIIRHIGNFTYFLSLHASDYGANLDSVFVSGGSAGGHLTCATALGIDSGLYTDIFSSMLNIRGLIPFYPANRMYDQVDVFQNPALLVESDSPACLIFQGKQDGLVKPEVSEDLLNTYISKGNTRCAILYMPFAGHASDFYFTTVYNKIFLYYMERFMYLFH